MLKFRCDTVLPFHIRVTGRVSQVTADPRLTIGLGTQEAKQHVSKRERELYNVQLEGPDSVKKWDNLSNLYTPLQFARCSCVFQVLRHVASLLRSSQELIQNDIMRRCKGS